MYKSLVLAPIFAKISHAQTNSFLFAFFQLFSMQKNLYSVNRKESTTEFNAKYPHTLKKHLLQRLTQFLICHLLSILFICRKKIRTHRFHTHKKHLQLHFD